MPQENKVSIRLKPEGQKKVIDSLMFASEVLKPYLVALTPAERQELPKMSDGTVPFVQKTLEYAQINAQFVPAYVDVKELKVDFDAVEALAHIFRPVEQLY